MKIAHRIFLLILITTALSTLTNLFLTRYQSQSIYEDSEKILALTLTHSLRDAVVQDVIDNNKLRVTNLLRKLKNNKSPIEFLYVRSDPGKVFAHSFEKGFPRYLLHAKTTTPQDSETHLVNKYLNENGTLIYEYSTVLIPGLDTSLHIGINQTYLTNILAENSRFTFFMSMAISLIALFVALLWGRQLTAPLRVFAEQIKRFGAGESPDFNGFQRADPDIQKLTSTFAAASRDRDIALAKLREREQDLAITLNSIGDAVMATDARGVITQMNPVAERLTGWWFAEAKGKTLKEVFPIIDASTRKTIENPVDKVISSGEIIHLSNHTTLIAKNGEEYQIADSAAPIRDELGQICGVVLVFNDVTEQYRLREEAKKSRRDLLAIMNHSPSIISLKDLQGRFIFTNRQFETKFRQRHDSLSGKTVHDVFPAEIADIIQDRDDMVLASLHILETREEIPLGDSQRVFSSIRFPLFDNQNVIYAICTISTDITEREQQEEQLRRAQKMDALGKLSGGIAHDYNNMLGVITGYSELLKESLKGNDVLLDYVQEIYHAGERGSKLTKKLLAFSRSTPTKAAVLDINKLLLDERQMLEKTLTARIQLKYELEAKVWPLNLDDSEFEDAVVNLCINSMHAIDGNGLLVVQTSNKKVSKSEAWVLQIPAGEYVMLAITDDGCGMDKQTRDKMFEPFFSTKGEFGTGLGLSQVYSFVRRSGGAIDVFSQPGHGTRFELYFPRYTVVEKPAPKNDDIDTNNYSGSESILFVDDEPSLASLGHKILEARGYKVDTANNAKAALAILKQQHIDLLISDIIMPEMDGYQLAAIVQEKYPHIKIQLMSGYAKNRNNEMVENELSQNIIQKPFHAKSLLRRVREVLNGAEVIES